MHGQWHGTGARAAQHQRINFLADDFLSRGSGLLVSPLLRHHSAEKQIILQINNQQPTLHIDPIILIPNLNKA